jgi:GntR family transcriptional regulator / MocR family aminotransferase
LPGLAEPPLVLDRRSTEPLTVQITGQLRAAVAAGLLRAGERLPSSRSLAGSLGVSRTVVTNAYSQLFAEGWLEGRHGSGTYVAPGAGAQDGTGSRGRHLPPAPGAVSSETLSSGATPPVPRADVIELRPGVPWVAGIDPAAWRRAWRRASGAAPTQWPDPRGLLALRAALREYLRRSRGLDCAPDQILITRGVANGLSLLAAALLRPGDRVGIEEPGYPVGRAILARSGAQVVPCRVDAHGLVVRDLPADLRLVYVTPAHQYPLGGRLPVPRRQGLVAWARQAGALVVEDDYDSEFRYDVAPLPALYGFDPGVVAYLGTTAKTLTPVLSVGWLVAAPALVTLLADTRESLGDRTDEAAQQAMLALIETGDLERHIRQMRREYARRRDAIVSILGDPAVPARLLGDTAGLHVVLELDHGGEAEVAAAALARGVAVCPLRRYFGAAPTVQGLVLGYGSASFDQVVRAASVLREILVPGPA